MTNRFWTLVFSSSLSATVAWGAIQTVDTTGWTGDGTNKVEVGGEWRWTNLGAPFADGAARLAVGASITSPQWPALDILGIDVKLRCTTNAPSRSLQVSFMRDGRVVAGPNRFEAVFRANRAESQRVPVRREKHANGLALSLSDGALGDWGVYEISVATAATTRKKAGFAVIMQ